MPTIPTRAEAEALLLWGETQNPGPWIDHTRVVARAAETIAARCGMDTHRAYVSGLLHDIGYYANADRSGRVCHLYAGYRLLMEKGWPTVAEICLSHPFPFQEINCYLGFHKVEDEAARAFLAEYVKNAVFNEYDKLIQLCDVIAGVQGVCIIEQRMVDALIRHGMNPFAGQKIQGYFDVKKHFDTQCGENIYNFFREEIIAGVFA